MNDFIQHFIRIRTARLLAAFCMLGCMWGATAQTLLVVDAASFSSDAVAPGSIVTIFGGGLSASTAAVTSAANPPATLGGTSVTIGGVAAALFYVSPVQINAVVPATAPAGMDPVVVTSAAGMVNGAVTVSTMAAPGLFSLVGAGIQSGAIVDALTGRIGAFSVSHGTSATFLSLYLTGANLTATPVVTIGGVAVNVTFAGASPCCAGLQQINISLPASLAGAGRVPVVVQAAGQLSNVVEIVLLPAEGEGEFDNDQDNVTRSRELSSVASIPGTSLGLVADENDDVVREIDASQKKVLHTISLPEGSMPSAIAVNAAGTIALVAERNRGKVAFVDLTSLMVQSEVAVGAGPVAIAIQGSRAVVVNGDGNSISVIDLTTNTVAETVTVGSHPRGVAIDAAGLIYVTNQNDGTITVVSLASGMSMMTTLNLGAVRPAAIQIIPGTTFAVVADPATSPNGKVLVVNLATGASTPFNVSPVRLGGASDIVVIGTTAWIANQAGGTISILPLTITATTVTGTATTITVDPGVRSLAFDAKDNLILAVNESAGKVVLVSVPSGTIAGSIVAIKSDDGDDDDQDDHSDHDGAINMPHVLAITPFKADIGTTITVTAVGINLQGATALVFSPADGITVGNLAVNAAGTQVTATVMVGAQTKPGAKKVSIVTPNGTTIDQAMIVVNP